MEKNLDKNGDGGELVVGVLADTHGRLPQAAFEALAGCDRIIHAGDIGGLGIIRELETLAPVVAVLGNNDFDEYGAGVGRFARPVIGGVRFLVAHYPSDVHIGWSGGRGVPPGEPLPQVCIHGHTHVPNLVSGKDAAPCQYLICPGSVTRPRGGSRPSIAKIVVSDGRIADVSIEELR